MVCAFEQRQSRRSAVRWPVSVWHPMAARFINGRSLNVSSDGALVLLPMQSPIKEGQSVEVNFPRAENLASEKGRCARIKAARVIRVDRNNVLDNAAIKVALEFCEKAVPVEAI